MTILKSMSLASKTEKFCILITGILEEAVTESEDKNYDGNACDLQPQPKLLPNNTLLMRTTRSAICYPVHFNQTTVISGLTVTSK